jgi:uncharacterized protein (TIGR02391 family)
MLEASKNVFDKIRNLTGLADDGALLVDAALSLGKAGTPRLRINQLATPTDRDEQNGLANLIKGLSGMFRNPVAHDPRLNRQASEDELLELLTMLSMVHRRRHSASSASAPLAAPAETGHRTKKRGAALPGGSPA